jgi:ribosomal protein S18 acetylase RimI-like enzyme
MYKIIILKKNYTGYADSIVEFYAPQYKYPFTKKTVQNSAIICLAYDGDKIIGGIRAISDLSRHGLIVDLAVEEKHRKQNVGTELLQSIISELKKDKVKNIGLTTEPGIDWLANFYKKSGFEELNESKYLKLKS